MKIFRLLLVANPIEQFLSAISVYRISGHDIIGHCGRFMNRLLTNRVCKSLSLEQKSEGRKNCPLSSRCHGQTTGKRPIMETHRTDSTQTPASSKGRQATNRQPQNFERNHFRTQNRYPLAISAKGNGLQKRYDMLATPARLAKGRYLGQDTPHPTEPFTGKGQDRLFSCSGRFGFSASRFLGGENGPECNGSTRRKLGLPSADWA